MLELYTYHHVTKVSSGISQLYIPVSMPFNKLISIPLNQHFLRKVRRAISLVRAKNIGSVRLNIQPECIQTIIMA